MTVEYACRTGNTYYLHGKTTAAGRPSYFFSMDAAGQLAPSIPNGYEIYENVGGQVLLRKKTAQTIRPEELSLVEGALLKHGEPWQYRAEVKKNAIVVHAAGGMDGRRRCGTNGNGCHHELRPTHPLAVIQVTS
jgi:hypothetical protein